MDFQKKNFNKAVCLAIITLVIALGFIFRSCRGPSSQDDKGSGTPVVESVDEKYSGSGKDKKNSNRDKSDSLTSDSSNNKKTDGVNPSAVKLTVIPPNTCFIVNYKHKKLSGHKNIDDCSTHKNIIEFKPNESHPDLAGKSVCVRMDGTPVKFESNKNKWIIGPVAGPDSTISVRYCPAKTKQDCKLPKDSFIEAIGGEQENENSVVHWDGSKGEKKDLDVDSELGPELYPEGSDHNGLTSFEGWAEVSSSSEPIKN